MKIFTRTLMHTSFIPIRMVIPQGTVDYYLGPDHLAGLNALKDPNHCRQQPFDCNTLV